MLKEVNGKSNSLMKNQTHGLARLSKKEWLDASGSKCLNQGLQIELI